MLNTVSKSAFAKLANVTPGRVTQWITEGKIADCLVGEGRHAVIDVDKALEKLKLRIDPGQRTGNGLKTVLAPAKQDSAPPPSEVDGLDLSLKRAKLEEAEARNRKLREEEQARRGIYVLAEHASAEAGKLASTILQMFEGGLTDVAAEIAATYKLPQRDVVHLMRRRFRDTRTQISASLANAALALPPTIDDAESE
jgi:hypothetical protein